MSAPLIISIPHRLGKQEAMRRLQSGFAQAKQTLGENRLTSIDYAATDDRMDFSVGALGQVVRGHVEVFEEAVRLEAYLPWVLSIFAQRAKTYLENRGTLMLEKK